MADGASRLAGLGGQDLDMIVVGGGITGCGIAREATMRGVRVALLEQHDFGSGTSSRSSRLIHGGVRYLEHGHLRLVFEASAERRRLLRLAPHLVHPLEFAWPVYRGARVPRWKLAAGLMLYDALALFRNVGRHRLLSAEAMRREQPALKTDGLLGGATYFDASTDDARLTLAVALDAADRGAVMLNYARAVGLIIENGRAVGVDVRDELTGDTSAVRARVIVNATGPWSDDFRRLESAAGKSKVRGSKGVHIAVPEGRVGNHGALTLLSPTDGRVMFVLPGGTHTIIGTTDTFTGAAPDEIRASETDVAYLLAAANAFFPAAKLTRRDVISAWAGIRPLAATESGDSVAASREHMVTTTAAGVVTITGGKLTTFRVMADDTVKAALRSIGLSEPKSGSQDAPLRWDLSQQIETVIASATRITGDAELATHLIRTYGAVWNDAWQAMASTRDGASRIEPLLPYRVGEVVYACKHEQARTLGDLLIRRMHIAFTTRDHGRAAARRIAPDAARVLGWSADQTAEQLKRYEREVERIFSVEPD